MEALITQTSAIQTETIYASKAAVVNSAGRLLLLWRNLTDDIRPGGVDFPGGQLHEGETFGQALAREFQEETGHPMEGMQEYWSKQFSKVELRPTGEKHITTEVRVIFAPQWDNKTPIIDLGQDREHDRYRWAQPEQVMRQRVLAQSASKSACLDIILDLQQHGELPKPPRWPQ